MYELYINDNLVELPEGEIIPLIYQLNDLGNLENRNANRTYTIKIPKTITNMKIFGFVNLPEAGTDIPYNIMTTKLKQFGIDLVSNGWGVLDEITDYFEFNVYFNNADFFGAIKDKKLSILELSSYEDIWTPQQKLNYIIATSGLVYPLVDWNKDHPNGNMLYNGNVIVGQFIYPAFYLHTLFDEILTQNGYTYELNLNASKLADFNNKQIPLPTKKADDRLRENCLVEYKETTNRLYHIYNASPQRVQFTEKVTDMFDLFSGDITDLQYNIPADGNYSFTSLLNFVVIGTYAASVTITMRSNKGHSMSVTYLPGTTHYSQYFFLHNINLNEGDYVCLELTTVYAEAGIDIRNFALYPLKFECFKSDLIYTGQYVDYPIAVNLPDMTQSDLVKFVMQRYGLFCFTKDRHVTFFSLTDIINNKMLALDITDKVVSEQKEFEGKQIYVDGFAQSNKWGYAVDENENSGIIICNNVNIENEKTIYTAPFTECEDIIRLNGIKMANIKRLEYNNTSAVCVWKREVKPKIISSYLLTQNFTWYISGDSRSITAIMVGVFDDDINTDSCDMQKTLDLNYIELANVLTYPSKIKIKVYFDLIDFLNINPLHPVYLWGKYYILNKIPSFVAGKVSTLELIKI